MVTDELTYHSKKCPYANTSIPVKPAFFLASHRILLILLISCPPADFPVMHLCRNKTQIKWAFIKWAVRLENYSFVGKALTRKELAELEQLRRRERKLTRTLIQQALQRKVIWISKVEERPSGNWWNCWIFLQKGSSLSSCPWCKTKEDILCCHITLSNS